ncbi:hypothetical protein JCM11641_006277 [Rhodosporidiobolus odoratus]
MQSPFSPPRSQSFSTQHPSQPTWTHHFEAVQEEFTTYGLSTRCHALKLILSATTEMSEDDLEDLDEDVLASPEYSDDFFLHPSSWLCCSSCGQVGPLVTLLHHSHQSHPLPRLVDLETQEMPIELPLEVACALSAVFELGQIDEKDTMLTTKKLDKRFADNRFVWQNAPKGSGGRKTWDTLVSKIRSVGAEFAQKGLYLPVAVISIKDLNARERFRKNQLKYGW